MSLYNKGMLKSWVEKLGLITVMLLVISSFTLSSQEDRRSRRALRAAQRAEALADSIKANLPDSIIAYNDSIRVVKDSIARADSILGKFKRTRA